MTKLSVGQLVRTPRGSGYIVRLQRDRYGLDVLVEPLNAFEPSYWIGADQVTVIHDGA